MDTTMARSLGNLIADSINRGLIYAEKLLTDVSDERFARFAAPGGTPVVSNHPAFVYGHLSIYPAKMLADLGLDAPALPEGFATLFERTATCEDDLDSTIYPERETITDFFFESHRSVMAALREVEDTAFDKPNPLGEPAIKVFPTLGSMHVFYGSGHIQLHLGQMSAWRRMEGLGSLG